MQNILVPTDFSKNATKAVTYASEVALKTGGTLYLMHVIEPTINMATMQADSMRPKILKERTSMLKIARDTISIIYPGVKVITHLAGGSTEEAIVHFSKKENMDMIIMGTTGASGIKKLLFGSVASAIIATSGIPVLTVPAAYTPEEPENILFATNKFEKHQNILNQIFRFSRIFSATNHIVIFKEKDGDKHADLIYNEAQLNDYLQFLKESYPGIDFKGAILEGEDFETTLDEYRIQQAIDLIAMVTYPKSFWEKILNKSATKQMAFHSTAPLLAIPANLTTT